MSFFDTLYEATGLSFVMELFNKKENLEPQNNSEQNKEEFYLKEVKPMSFKFRPQYLSQYIGQEAAKDRVSLYIDKIIKGKISHQIIVGNAGCGKTTLAYIIKNHLDFDITTQIGGAFTEEGLRDFLIKNEKSKKPNILFIDEIHNLDKKLAERMYPLLEDFELVGQETVKIRPFIFIGATTEYYTLLKKVKPLVDRCGGEPIYIESYKSEDIKQIIKQYNKEIDKEEVSEEIFDIISKNSRYIPRIAIALWNDFIVCRDIKRILKSRRIIKDSLTITDINILKHLIEIGKPVGEEVLSIIAQVPRADFKLWYEPFLITENLMTRTARGRIATNKAKEFLRSLNV